ncbi:DUF4064 domain-containing protein [Staphylococcus sp. NAM3COL9]|uniref:DUF4064 domain-containing protein n=1 Tax=Staphylococcus sp. NAM3COL9 TaxID=1667172 RepID=UPI000710C5B5|nr:DUF4064 domain-containing protein [Staphylococcus sp. NAM3COL9]KRG08373.1 hypothetical protein ACA31_11475 [Staphylococcus sp. NAM3COL9]
MKRTVEKILTWVGIILQFILIFLMAIVTPFLNDASVKDSLIQSLNNSQEFNQVSNQMTPSQLLEMASSLFIIALGVVIICTIIAIIFALLINKIPKVSGVVLIVIAIVTVFTFNWITALLWFIAGILLLVRKAYKPSYEGVNNSNNRSNTNNHYQEQNTEVKDESREYRSGDSDFTEQEKLSDDKDEEVSTSDEHTYQRRKDRIDK